MAAIRPEKVAANALAEGVGFEPTVGYPTLDFESSALNRTQPPFPFSQIAGPRRSLSNARVLL